MFVATVIAAPVTLMVTAAPASFETATAERPRLYVLPTYTALLELRDELAGRGHVARFWERDRVVAR